jgi:hypothetical protein
MTENARVLGQQGTQPDGTFWHREPHHLLADESDGELAKERSLPVMAIRQHQDLPVVADLEEFFGASVHRAHHDAGRGDHVVLGPQP